MNQRHPFDLLQNFLHLPTKDDGSPYAPELYKEFVRECFVISKNLNTSYTDVLSITPTERKYLLEFIKEEFEQAKKMRQEQMEQFNRG